MRIILTFEKKSQSTGTQNRPNHVKRQREKGEEKVSSDFSKFPISEREKMSADGTVKGVGFTLKFAVTSLCLAKHRNDDVSESLLASVENLSLEISFDQNVIAMENITTDEFGQMRNCLGAAMSIEASSNEEFADKLATHPIVFRLIQRSDVEIGSQTLRPSDCFVKSTKSETFSCATLCKRVNIIGGDGRVNAKLSLILLIEKTSQAAAATVGGMEDVKMKTTIQPLANSNKVNPTAVEMCHRRKIEKVSCSSSSSSALSRMAINIPQKSIKRVCSKCFDDLSVLPGDAKCPKCSYHRRVHDEIAHSKRLDEKMRALENVNIQKCIKLALEELLGGDRQQHLMKKSSQRVEAICRTERNRHSSRKSNFTTLKKGKKSRKVQKRR